MESIRESGMEVIAIGDGQVATKLSVVNRVLLQALAPFNVDQCQMFASVVRRSQLWRGAWPRDAFGKLNFVAGCSRMRLIIRGTVTRLERPVGVL